MRNGDGLSRKKRLERLSVPRLFTVIEADMLSLLQQAEVIAGFIRYYNLNNEQEGHFDQLLPHLHEWIRLYSQGKRPVFDGTTEPSQALLFTFLQQLHRMADRFNKRWEQLPYWYLNETLGIENLPARPDSLWVAFRSELCPGVVLPKETKFIFGTTEGAGSVYHLKDETVVEQTTVYRLLSWQYKKEKKRYPASALDCVTSVESGHGQPGFILSSVSLLLRKGRRSVTIRFESETPALTDFIRQAKSVPESPFDGWTDEEIADKLLTGIFRLQISTADGWKEIEHYHLTNEQEAGCDHFVLKFTLSENFPPTSGCMAEVHGLDTRHSSLKVELNCDAWLYPYSWIRNVQLKRIGIYTEVEGISDFPVYNDLGRIDNSKPFAPFGINTEQGAWLVVGNYEMATKNAHSIDLHIQWGELPDMETGLYGYYQGYGSDIDNCSFWVKTEFLREHQWQTDADSPLLPLFDTVGKSADGMPLKQARLAGKSVLKRIDINQMPPIIIDEEFYEYDIRTRSGFARLVLEDPPMGFGEKRYRQLFTGQMLHKAARKKSGALLNPPMTPRIERMTLSYRAQDWIELPKINKDDRHELWHLSPLGYKKVYPQSGSREIPLIYSVDHNMHILLGLENIRGGELLHFYFDFVPMRLEVEGENDPALAWYWGDGYTWEAIPDGVITRDSTRNFFVSGEMVFSMPEKFPDCLYDKEGVFWLRAAVVKGQEFIAEPSRIYINATELIRDQDEQAFVPGLEGGGVQPVNEISGLSEIYIISAPHREHTAEDDRHKLMRVSEYATHRGKAVTPRDFERIVLQAFPQVGKVKCLPAFDAKGGWRKGVVTLVVVPRQTIPGENKAWIPQASSGLLAEIEAYLKERCSATISKVDALNPLYEEVFLRCRLKFASGYSLGGCRSALWKVCNDIIAPWQKSRRLPVFDYRLQLSKFRTVIEKKEFVEKLEFLSLVRIAKTGDDEYRIDEYYQDEEVIAPGTPYSVFIPTRHIFNCGETDTFGFGEMTIGETCIIDRMESGN